MSAKDATPQEIQAMKDRLAQKQAARRFDAEAAEAINMVHHRQPLVVEERMTPLEKREYVGRVIPAGRAFSASAVAFLLARAFTDNWLFLLALSLTVFTAAAIA